MFFCIELSYSTQELEELEVIKQILPKFAKVYSLEELNKIVKTYQKYPDVAKFVSQVAFAFYERENSLGGYQKFLHEYPNFAQKEKVHRKIFALYQKRNDFTAYEEFAEHYPGQKARILESYRKEIKLRLIGPPERKIRDLLEYLKTGLSESLIVSQVKQVKSEYQRFSIQEIMQLKKMGLPENIIIAMIEMQRFYAHSIKAHS